MSGRLLLTFLPITLAVQTFDRQTLLDEVKEKVAATVQRAPRYTCTESIERYWFANRKAVRPGCDTDRARETVERNLVRSDRLRLDVAVGPGQEMFSWHGQKTFKTDQVDQLVTAGPIASGYYFSFLKSIFLEGVARVDYRGVRKEEGRQVAVFGYSVPIGKSGFETRTDSGTDVMGYHGEFTVDAATKELEQLEILTDDMPPSAQVCGFNSKTRYAERLLKGARFELPERVEMDVLYRNHERARTVTEFSQCHEFTAESVLRFDGAEAGSPAETPEPLRTLPAGLAVRIRITSHVDLDKAWAGDALEGELSEDIVDPQGKIVTPKGTAVQGLFLRVETGRRPIPFHSVALQFREMAVGGKDYRLNLKSVPEPVSDDGAVASMPTRMQLANPPITDDPQACRFRLTGKVKLKGVITYWVTR